MLDIDIDYSSLGQAVADLRALKDELCGGTEVKYLSDSLINSSQGDTCDSLNSLYTRMAEYQLELMDLVGKTEVVMKSIGITFAEEENTSAQESIQSGT